MRSGSLLKNQDDGVTFHVHALHVHRAATISGKWLSKPLSQALLASFIDQLNAEPGAVTKLRLSDVTQVVVDGVPADMKQPVREFARVDGAPVQIILEISEDPGRKKKGSSTGKQNAIPEYLGPTRTGEPADAPNPLLAILDEEIKVQWKEAGR